jgi:hypothetical protein
MADQNIVDATIAEATAELTPDHVRRRVDDWIKRVNDLYDLVERTLGERFIYDRAESHHIHEELSQRLGLTPDQLPTVPILRLDSRVAPGEAAAYLQPRALWIIGANGGLDLVLGRDLKPRWTFFDTAVPFSPPHWIIANAGDPFDRQDLTATGLIDSFRDIA